MRPQLLKHLSSTTWLKQEIQKRWYLLNQSSKIRSIKSTKLRSLGQAMVFRSHLCCEPSWKRSLNDQALSLGLPSCPERAKLLDTTWKFGWQFFPLQKPQPSQRLRGPAAWQFLVLLVENGQPRPSAITGGATLWSNSSKPSSSPPLRIATGRKDVCHWPEDPPTLWGRLGFSWVAFAEGTSNDLHDGVKVFDVK